MRSAFAAAARLLRPAIQTRRGFSSAQSSLSNIATRAAGPSALFQKGKRPRRSESIYLMLLVGAASTSLMYIIRLRNEKDRVEMNYTTQKGLMERAEKRIAAGETLDLEKELLLDTDMVTDDISEIMRSLQETDEKWRQARTVLELRDNESTTGLKPAVADKPEKSASGKFF